MCCWRFFWKSLRICFFHINLSNLRTRNEFTVLLFNVCSHYISSREDSSLLREISQREPVWSYIIDLCSSFAARDCSACFHQIFEKRTFGCLHEEEESLFMTLRKFDSFCRSCSSSVTLNSSLLLTVVTAYRLNQLSLDNNMWLIFLTPANGLKLFIVYTVTEQCLWRTAILKWTLTFI